MSQVGSDVQLPQTSPLSSQLTKVNNLYELFNCQQYSHCISGEDSYPLTQILKQNTKVHHQLLDCMICIQNQQLTQLINQKYSQAQAANLPYKCYKLLQNLNEQYVAYLFSTSQQSQKQKQDTNSLLKHYFEVFKEQEINQTAAGYVLKINEMIIMRQSSFPLFEWLNKQQEILENIYKHFDSCSAVGVINRVLDLDSQIVPDEKRFQMINKIFEKIAQLSSKYNKPDLISGLHCFVDDQLQRALSSDNSQNLSDQIANAQNLQKLQRLPLSCPQSIPSLLKILSSILNHYKKQQPKSQNSPHRNFMGYRSPPQLIITSSVMQQIVKILKNIEQSNLKQQSHNKSDFINIRYLNHLEVLSFISLYNRQYLSEVVSVGLINNSIDKMEKYNKNNILHNYCQDIIQGFIKIQEETFYQNKELKLIDFVFNKFTVKECYYRQHLFTILKKLLEDPSFEEHAQQFTQIQISPVLEEYKRFLDLQPKPQAEDPNPSNDSIIDNELADFDPTANVDTLSPYYYQEMIIDDTYEKEDEKKQKGGSYADWMKGIIKGGIIKRDIDIDIGEVESPVIYRDEIDRDKIWGEHRQLRQSGSLLDSENEEGGYLRKLSNNKGKEKQSQFYKQTEYKSDIINDEKQQENMQLSDRKISDQNKPTQKKQFIKQVKKNKKENDLPAENTQTFTQQSNEQRQNTGTNRSVIKIILSPFYYIADFFWNLAE